MIDFYKYFFLWVDCVLGDGDFLSLGKINDYVDMISSYIYLILYLNIY